MPPLYFPLRWESTGDQWWYASPIDWAAANGLYDLITELLHLDTNLLIKLTSLRRIRRLETVWDDESQFHDVAKHRAYIAKRLLSDCKTNTGENSLIKSGYGGWLLYTAASAGDVDFVKQLLDTDPLLVFGEGEYGVTDILYAAARSKNCDVFKLLVDFCPLASGEGELTKSENESIFKWEMMNRAVHSAARGGNLGILRELVGDDDASRVSEYRDAQGSTILHTASGRGQVEVVKHLVSSFDIITSTDNQGNTALHVAAYRGYLPVVELLVSASPSLTSLTNNHGDTFLHMVVAGFRIPGFRRIDRQIQLMKLLVSGNLVNIQDIINVKNQYGRTVLHMAVIDNIQADVVLLLMKLPSIDLNARDDAGMTPLDLLKQRPRSVCSEILIKQLISAGGISNYHDNTARTIVFHLKEQDIGRSPGTSFRIPDAEIFLYTGIENGWDVNGDQASMVSLSTCLSEKSDYSSNSIDSEKTTSVKNVARRLRFLLRWPRTKEKKSIDEESLEASSLCRNWEKHHVPLRQIYSSSSSLLKNKRVFCSRKDLPSPSTRKKFTRGLSHGVLKATPNLALSDHSCSLTFSEKLKDVTNSPGMCLENQSLNGKISQRSGRKQVSLDKKLMNQYLCFGAEGLALQNSNHTRRNWSLKDATSVVA